MNHHWFETNMFFNLLGINASHAKNYIIVNEW